ncbi:hypothetical protein P154DRAFT_519314 [Amniculicola lignicola CBS 123094]|uniref:Uncharacterized protein n=1 Tax=Amniculicola lignicola CBS 123094 TaxID=1392246 RepID=A0A6A5WS90_9PLEO|nr:hypothetical protein P154DRAFT_519314 [Amniculicola lignicola CBS 123094]
MIRGVGVPSSKCTSWERANVLLLEDGTKYSLEGVDDDQYAEFSESVANATVKEDVPEEFKQFEAEE